jgi:hypothetical protein
METKPKRGKRGQGSVYRPKNSRFWRVKFSVHGRVINESAETESKREALGRAQGQDAEIFNGQGCGFPADHG